MKYSFLIPLYLICCLTMAQSTGKWGKLTKEEMALTAVSYEPEAEAVILNEQGQIRFDGGRNAFITVHKKIKILKEPGLDYADQSVYFYSNEGLEEITAIKAQVLNVVNGKIEKTPLKAGEFFTRNENRLWSKVTFSFPNVKVGSVLELRYTKRTKRVFNLEGWVFQHEIPTLFSKVTVSIPEYLTYRVVYNGSRLQKKYLSKATNTWELDRVYSLKKEDYIGNVGDYAEKIYFQMEQYLSIDNLGNSSYVTTMSSWEKLSSELILSAGFNSYSNRNTIYGNILEKIHPAGKPPVEKIYNYVRDNFTWDGFSGYYPSKNLQSLLKDQNGDASSMNHFLSGLMKTAGYDSYPMLISTRSHGLVSKSYPLISQFNYSIAYVNDNGQEYFMDVTDKFMPYNLTNSKCLNGQGLIIKKEPEWKKVKPGVVSSKVVSSKFSFDSLMVLESGITVSMKGQFGYEARKRSNSLGRWLDEESENYDIAEEYLSVTDDPKKDLRIEIEFGSEAKTAGSLIYLQPIPLLNQNENPFKLARRLYPIEYPFKFTETYTTSITIPEGYRVESMPESKALGILRDKVQFTYEAKRIGNRISIVSKFQVNTNRVSQNYYKQLKQIYDEMIASNNEPVVLKQLITDN